LINIIPNSDNAPHKRKNIGEPYPKFRERAFSENKIRAAEVHLLVRIGISLKEFILNLINIPRSTALNIGNNEFLYQTISTVDRDLSVFLPPRIGQKDVYISIFLAISLITLRNKQK
jgi:hypothetical protein